jgi:hypothetical protein
MVNLMLQPVFLNLVKGSTDSKMTSDDLYNMWSVASRAKSAIVQGRRLENLSWRLWYTSTIRSKVEMEEKRRISEIEKEDSIELNNSENEEIFIEPETETESNTSTSSSSQKTTSKSKSSNSKKNLKGKELALVLPSDRPLFTSTCTSILAEIQDASFRFSGTATSMGGVAGFNINQSHFMTSYNHNHNINGHANTNTSHHHHHHHNANTNIMNNHVHIISPPTNRSKSPGTSNNSTPKRKKNVEKFLKKFKSNLEDISEQMDEKLNFSDEETGEEQVKEKASILEQHNTTDNTEHTDASIKSLSPTTSSNHYFATDEEGQFSSFYARDSDINVESPVMIIKSKNQPSMISKLLKKDSSINGSGSCINSLRNTSIQAPNFLFNQNNDGKYIDDKLELLESNNGYDHDDCNIKSETAIMMMKTMNNNEKKIIDANALSTSLSANKFKLEDEFDSQLVIW